MTPQELLIKPFELAQLTEALRQQGIPEPMVRFIGEAEAQVADYTIGYQVDAARQAQWVRALAVWRAFAMLGSIPANRQSDYDAAMQELRDVRDGKFRLPRNDPQLAPMHGSAWGSEPRIRMSAAESDEES